MNIITFLLFVLLIAPICTIVHEFGHVLGAIIARADTASLSIGSGKVVKQFSVKRLKLLVHSLFFLGGKASSERSMPYTSKEIIWITGCAPAANASMAYGAYMLVGFANVYVELFILYNAWLAIINMVPFKLRGKYSDGYAILKTITQACTNVKYPNNK